MSFRVRVLSLAPIFATIRQVPHFGLDYRFTPRVRANTKGVTAREVVFAEIGMILPLLLQKNEIAPLNPGIESSELRF